ncbi:MAG TPA: LysR family transcriptional regulator substrate-binding protein, partial [Dehalococcoidia bacterium]|nr:LysR family transcriptional regulator substrate-binding protein [Dehalococcoidia bacterium]
IETATSHQAARVRLGCSAELAPAALFRLIRVLRDTAPEVVVDLSRSLSEAIVQSLREGLLDLALIDQRPREPGLRSRRLLTDEIVLVVSADHPWAGRGSIRAEELLGQSLVVSTHVDYGRLIEDLLDRQHVRLHQVPIAVQVDSSHDALAAVAQGLGVSFVSRGFAQHASSKTVAVQVDGVSLRREVFLVLGPAKARTPAGHRLEAFLRSPLAAKLLAGEG